MKKEILLGQIVINKKFSHTHTTCVWLNLKINSKKEKTNESIFLHTNIYNPEHYLEAFTHWQFIEFQKDKI